MATTNTTPKPAQATRRHNLSQVSARLLYGSIVIGMVIGGGCAFIRPAHDVFSISSASCVPAATVLLVTANSARSVRRYKAYIVVAFLQLSTALTFGVVASIRYFM